MFTGGGGGGKAATSHNERTVSEARVAFSFKYGKYYPKRTCSPAVAK